MIPLPRSDQYAPEFEKNVFSRFYRDPTSKDEKFERKTDSDVQDALRNYTHSEAIEFAAMTWSWDKNRNKALPRDDTDEDDDVGIPEFNCQMGLRAFYRVLIEKKEKYILIACHANVHGFHRGDLLFVEVNNRTVLRGAEKYSVMGKLFPGDVIAVTKMGRKSKDVLKPVYIHRVKPDSDCVWEVQNMTLLTRKKYRDVNFSVLENGTAVVEGCGQAMNVTDDKTNRLHLDKLYEGVAFVPEKIKMNFTEDFHRKDEIRLTALASNLPTYPNSLGTIYFYVFFRSSNSSLRNRNQSI